MSADRLVLVVALLAGGLATRIDAQPVATEGQADWRLDSPLASSRGRALWLDDGAGSWRLEIGIAEDAAAGIDDLFVRYGEGWTLACAGRSPTLLQPWGQPWREASPGFAAAVVTTLQHWEGAAAVPHPVPRPWRARQANVETASSLIVEDLPEEWNPATDPGGAGGNLRRELTARGRGRGGPGLRLRLVRTPDGGLTLSTARWPGRLGLSAPVLGQRSDVPAEAYLPIWSLAEIGLTPRMP